MCNSAQFLVCEHWTYGNGQVRILYRLLRLQQFGLLNPKVGARNGSRRLAREWRSGTLNQRSFMNKKQQIVPCPDEPDDSGTSPTKAAKPISPAKLTANRANAKKSTGPRTERGKNASRTNSLKHGLYAQPFLILAGKHLPDYGQIECLLRAVRDELHPTCIEDTIAVEKFVVDTWRLRRSACAEFEPGRPWGLTFFSESQRYSTMVHRQWAQSHALVKEMRNRCQDEPVEDSSSDTANPQDDDVCSAEAKEVMSVSALTQPDAGPGITRPQPVEPPPEQFQAESKTDS